MFFPIVQGSAGGGALVLSVGTTSDYNILTAATAAGYTNGSGVPITVNVTGVVTGAPAMRTGAVDGANITVNILSGGQIDGNAGATGSTGSCSTYNEQGGADTDTPIANGGAGGVGGDALYWETVNSGTNVVNVNSGGYLRGGGGGGGGGGSAARQKSSFIDKGQETCDGNFRCGYDGSAGSAGAFGAAGSAGSDGTLPTTTQWPQESGFPAQCRTEQHSYIIPGSGGSGGAAGAALKKNSRTVTLNNSGTVAGSTT